MKRKSLLWILALLAASSLVVLGLRPQPVEVDLGAVTRGTLTVTVNEDGETHIREPYLISAPLSGRLLRVRLEPGDRITKDQILAAIDPGEPGLLDARSEAEAKARVRAAEAAHERAESQLDIARADLQKAQRYYERDLGRLERENISPAIVDDSEHALRVAKSNLAAAQSTLEIARFDLEQARAALLHSQSLAADGDPVGDRHFAIHSPIDGVVLRRYQESSTVIPAGESILEIGDPHDLEVKIDVLSQDAVKIVPGQRVAIEHWGGDRALTAWVRRVEPSAFTKLSALGVDEQRVWVYADFDATEPATQQGTTGDSTGSNGMNERTGLGDAFRIEARIVISESPDVLRIPAGALFRDGTVWCAYRITDSGKAELCPLELGGRNDLEAEVISGLAEGDRVILYPSDKVKPGVQVVERQ